MKKSVCQFDCQDIEVRVACLNKRCRYHQRLGQKYDQRHLSPSGLCLAAYQAVYPYCLALLYDANLGRKPIRIWCPAPENFILMEVTKEDALPKFILFLKRKLEKILAKIYRPIDLPDSRINIKIIDQKGCPKEYQIGRVFNFNLWRQNEICPAGFAQMYPILTQPKTKAKIFVACPDDNVVVYQIIKG